MISFINNFFFDADSISVSDSLFFYGILIAIIIIGIGVWFI